MSPTSDSKDPSLAIQSVADTAFWVATFRADETGRKDALFRDPLAARLVEGRGRELTARMRHNRILAWVLQVRTVLIDEWIARAIREGCDCVLNLGAGLDTRPYRLELPAPFKWIEVDFAPTIDFKEERLRGEAPRCNLERVRLDLGDAGARRALFEKVNQNAKKVFVLTEGVVPYLSNDAVAALAADLRAQPSFAWWMLDYQSESARMRIAKSRRMQMANAPFLFAPLAWEKFFTERGWKLEELRFMMAEGERLGRRFPLPFPFRLLMRVMPSKAREQMAKGFGYAVLVPR